MSANTPERFREVEPLRLGGRTLAEIRSCYDVRDTLDVRPRYHSIAEARALRDWLTKALPEAEDTPQANQDAKDALRYRWLKFEDQKRRPLATISWRQSDTGLPCMLGPQDSLDALIDAAIAIPGASVQEIYKAATKALPEDKS